MFGGFNVSTQLTLLSNKENSDTFCPPCINRRRQKEESPKETDGGT